MREDISRRAVLMLVIIAVIISMVSTTFVLNTVYRSDFTVDELISGDIGSGGGSGRVTLTVPQTPPSGRVTLTVPETNEEI